jgi:hypothetical protein
MVIPLQHLLKVILGIYRVGELASGSEGLQDYRIHPPGGYHYAHGLIKNLTYMYLNGILCYHWYRMLYDFTRHRGCENRKGGSYG